MANAVRVTLGPKGRYVVIDKKFGAPTITNDGVSIAREIELEEPFSNQGAQLVREVATATNDVAGDGTTTATVLAQCIVRDGLKNVAARQPAALKRGIEKAVDQVVDQIGKVSTEISGKDQIARVAAISAADDEIGDVIADAIDRVGKDGVVNVEEGQTFGMDLEFTEGMQFDKGYISPYMVTDQDRMEAVLEDPYILIANQKIGSVRDILPVLEQVIQSGKPILVIAEDVEGESLATFVVNKLRGTFTGVAVKAPGFGDRRKRMLEDIAILTGGEVITRRWASSSRTPSSAGRACRVVVAKDTTTIVDGAGESEAIKGRSTRSRTRSRTPTRTSTARSCKSGWRSWPAAAVVKVGAATETEMKEKKHRGVDAAGHPRGPRGGHRAGRRRRAAASRTPSSSRPSRPTSATRRSSPARWRSLCADRGQLGLRGSVVVNDAAKGKNQGLNADTGEIVDLVAAGVIDPAMVTRSASRTRLDREEHPHHRGDRRRVREGGRGRRRRHARRDGRHDVGRESRRTDEPGAREAHLDAFAASARLGRVRADGLPQALGSAAARGWVAASAGSARADPTKVRQRRAGSFHPRPSTDAIGMGCTPSASASPVPRLATIGSSISSASSQVTKTWGPIARRRARSGTCDRQRHVQQAPAAPARAQRHAHDVVVEKRAGQLEGSPRRFARCERRSRIPPRPAPRSAGRALCPSPIPGSPAGRRSARAGQPGIAGRVGDRGPKDDRLQRRVRHRLLRQSLGAKEARARVVSRPSAEKNTKPSRARRSAARSRRNVASVELLDRRPRLIADRGRQVDDRVDAAQRVAKRGRVGEVAQRDLHPHALIAEPARVAHEAAHRLPGERQAAEQGGADRAGRAGEQHHRRSLGPRTRA